MLQSKQELKRVITYEKKLWIKKMRPNERGKDIRSLTIIYMKALRIVEYYKVKSVFEKIGGGITTGI